MKATLLLFVLAICAAAQEPQRITISAIGEGPVGVGAMLGAAVKGAPYSATIVTESVQTLADGNRISHKSQGGVARDSQGRMRHEAVLPAIGSMAAAGVPKIVFINDPVAGATYTLNPAEKSYRKMPAPTMEHSMKRTAELKAATGATFNVEVAPPTAHVTEVHSGEGHAIAGGNAATEHISIMATKVATIEKAATKNESLGSKVIDGVMVEGTRSVRTIAAGEIGNDKAIEIVSESWFSPELKTVVYSKRSDPRTGDQVYTLTNISRAEPDASMFAIPAGYKASDATTGKDVIFYKQRQE